MKSLLAILISSALVVSGYSQTRNVLVNSNNAVVSPTNFWSVDASNARTGLGLGTAATNPASAFQPSSSVLSNLSSSNAVNLTNLRASNVVGVLSLERGGTGATNALDARTALGLGTASTNPASAFQPSSGVLSNLASSNAVDLTNLRATNIVGTIPASNISSLSLTNISGTLAISNGGSGATTAGEARTNFGLGATWLTNTVVSDFRTAIGLPLAALTNTNASNFRVAIGATTIGNALFTATNSAAAIDAIGISTNFSDQVLSVSNIFISSFPSGSGLGFVVPTAGGTLMVRGTNLTNAVPAFFGWNGFEQTAFSAATARTNLGLNAWTTNTNSPVFVGTNGEVVSPTNFWQVAPISTTVQYQTNVTGTSTNAATNSRNLFLFSLAPSVSGLTNTVTLPTNTATTFEGDRATIVHLATNSANTVTAIRQLGAATNLITLNQGDEAVLLMYRSGAWVLSDNISYVEPIFFSGTNAVANAAASRTNLGLGNNASPEFASLTLSDLANTNSVDRIVFVDDTGSFASQSYGVARTNLGLGATNNVTFNDVVASGTLTATSTVTAKTNLVVEGFVNYTAARTNNTPTNTPNFAAHAAWIEVKVGTNSFFLPAYQ